MLRAARIRRGWRQADLAARAGTSESVISRIERGHVGATSLDTLRRIGAALEVKIELLARSRAADLDRLVNARHAALAEAIVEQLRAAPGWVARPEVSFNVYGDRGAVDILAWHAGSRSLLVVEVKTEIVDVGELLGTLDRKRRLGAAIARGVAAEWRPVTASIWLAVADSPTNRRRIDAHRATFDASFAQDGRSLRAWLQRPAGELRARSFVADRRPGALRSGFATPRRVSGRRATAGGPASRSRTAA